MAYLARPDHAFQIAFNADPNDTAATPVWNNFTTLLRSASALQRGRLYELAQTMAASPEVLLKDTNEYLNPDNPSSPYAPNVVPYREVCWQCMWPNGGTGNLLNAGMWTPNDLAAYDPSFESYAVTTTPYWLMSIGLGVTPIVVTGSAHTGTKSVAYAVTAGGGTNGIGWTVPTIPGRQYTSSAWVRQTVANTTLIFVDGGAAGSSTTAVATYTRLTVTFTASQPSHNIWVASFSTSLTGAVAVDDIQHEPGGSASTFTTTGPVIYPVMRNYVERYQKQWLDNGYTGYVTLPCVDAFAALNSIDISTEYTEALTALAPDYYWTLESGSAATLWPETSGNGGPPLIPYASKYGAGPALQPGTSMTIAGDPGASGVGFTSPALLPGQQNAGTILAAGAIPNAGAFTLPATIGTSWEASTAVWVANKPTTPTSQSVVLVAGVPIINAGGGGDLQFPLKLTIYSNGQVEAKFGCIDTGGTFHSMTAVSAASTYNDGIPHLMIATIAQVNGGNTTLDLYVDNQHTQTVVTTASLGGMLTASANTVEVGGSFTRTVYDQMLNGPATRVAFWNRALSSTETGTLWTAGAIGYAGETSGARIGRHFTLGSFTPRVTPRISVGETTMEPPTFVDSIDLLTDSQNTTDAELGMLWVAPDGAVVFEDRNDRFLRLTPDWTLGENFAGGEIPYVDVDFETDPQYTYAKVQFSRNGGATASGGLAADIAAAQKRFFGRSFAGGGDLATDDQAQTLADWIFYTHNTPLTRVDTLTIDPAANPALWPFALSVEIGQRIRVKRRASAANGGTGLTITLDFFVEQVEHDGIDTDAGTWKTTVQMSPIGDATQPGSTQPWILEHPTYGQLGISTRLAP